MSLTLFSLLFGSKIYYLASKQYDVDLGQETTVVVDATTGEIAVVASSTLKSTPTHLFRRTDSTLHQHSPDAASPRNLHRRVESTGGGGHRRVDSAGAMSDPNSMVRVESKVGGASSVGAGHVRRAGSMEFSNASFARTGSMMMTSQTMQQQSSSSASPGAFMSSQRKVVVVNGTLKDLVKSSASANSAVAIGRHQRRASQQAGLPANVTAQLATNASEWVSPRADPRRIPSHVKSSKLPSAATQMAASAANGTREQGAAGAELPGVAEGLHADETLENVEAHARGALANITIPVYHPAATSTITMLPHSPTTPPTTLASPTGSHQRAPSQSSDAPARGASPSINDHLSSSGTAIIESAILHRGGSFGAGGGGGGRSGLVMNAMAQNDTVGNLVGWQFSSSASRRVHNTVSVISPRTALSTSPPPPSSSRFVSSPSPASETITSGGEERPISDELSRLAVRAQAYASARRNREPTENEDLHQSPVAAVRMNLVPSALPQHFESTSSQHVVTSPPDLVPSLAPRHPAPHVPGPSTFSRPVTHVSPVRVEDTPSFVPTASSSEVNRLSNPLGDDHVGANGGGVRRTINDRSSSEEFEVNTSQNNPTSTSSSIKRSSSEDDAHTSEALIASRTNHHAPEQSSGENHHHHRLASDSTPMDATPLEVRS
jgi:hypothetical protein